MNKLAVAQAKQYITVANSNLRLSPNSSSLLNLEPQNEYWIVTVGSVHQIEKATYGKVLCRGTISEVIKYLQAFIDGIEYSNR